MDGFLVYVRRIPALILVLSLLSMAAHRAYSSDDFGHFELWENETEYSKNYYVDQRHPLASDDNPGTAALPFKTISQASKLVRAGERVVINSGVYREFIRPEFGGLANDKMISYESVPGASVTVKGSRVLKTQWHRSSVKTDVLPENDPYISWSKNIWVTKVPIAFLPENYNPLALANIEPEEHDLMPWAVLVKERSPYILKRALLYENGIRLTQVASYEDLARVPGAYWVGEDHQTIHMHPSDGKNPNGRFYEIALQSHLFRPTKLGLDFIQVRGLKFQHCANGFLRSGTGAIHTMGGNNWIIEDNEISEVNSSGIEFGYSAYEENDTNPENVVDEDREYRGQIIVRNNRIYNAGTAGMRSRRVKDSLIVDNVIWNVGWQDAQNYWEVSGIKILRAHNILVKGNRIDNVLGGNGIWLDWDNRYSRVTKNVITNVKTIQGGIFIEASRETNLVDNNVVWDVDGSGIYLNDSDNTEVHHNLVGNTTGPVVTAIVATKREMDGAWLTAKNNRIFNNIFVDGAAPMKMNEKQNQADYNVYLYSKYPNAIDPKKWKKTGKDKHSTWVQGKVTFDSTSQFLSFNTEKPLPLVPRQDSVKDDFFLSEHDSKTIAGPFLRLEAQSYLKTDEGMLDAESGLFSENAYNSICGKLYLLNSHHPSCGTFSPILR